MLGPSGPEGLENLSNTWLTQWRHFICHVIPVGDQTHQVEMAMMEATNSTSLIRQ
jgi:hypothetical protein